MDSNKRMRSSNVQGFASKVLTLYEEVQDYMRMRSSIFTFHSFVAEYTTLCYFQV